MLTFCEVFHEAKQKTQTNSKSAQHGLEIIFNSDFIYSILITDHLTEGGSLTEVRLYAQKITLLAELSKLLVNLDTIPSVSAQNHTYCILYPRYYRE